MPLYLKYLGAEAYGLIGVFASFQIILSLLDSGLSTTLNRELAKLSATPNSSSEMKNLVRTLGTGYWVLALIIGCIAIGISPLIARYWVHPKDLSLETIQLSFFLLSASLIFQFPTSLYSGGLMGLQRQVPLNLLRIFFSTLKNFGGILILIFYSQTVTAFFAWALFVSIAQAITFRFTLWHFLPKSKSPAVFRLKTLRKVSRFAIGMSGITLTSVLFSQMDKIILSKILTLDQFGYYSIATTIGLLIYQIIGPITQTYFPKFAELIGNRDSERLKLVYHQASQLMSALVLPATFMLVLFSKDLLWIWTQNDVTVTNTWMIVAIFALGCGFNGLINIPYQLILAYGWVKLPFYQNCVLSIIMIPLTIWLTKIYGAVGGALSWLIINTIYTLTTPYLLHRRYLKGEMKYWYFIDILRPLIVVVLVMLTFKFFLNPLTLIKGRWTSLLSLITVGTITLGLTLLSLKDLKLKLYPFKKT